MYILSLKNLFAEKIFFYVLLLEKIPNKYCTTALLKKRKSLIF